MDEQFAARAAEVGARVHVAWSPEEAIALVSQIGQSVEARVALLSSDVGDLRGQVADALARIGAQVLIEPTPSAAAQADLGVSRVALAVAETGSIVIAGNDLADRLATMLPLVHVALVDSRAIASSLDEVGEYLRGITLATQAEQIRYVSLVSGPSRTADVEKTLSTGVHGPRELHIILIRRTNLRELRELTGTGGTHGN